MNGPIDPLPKFQGHDIIQRQLTRKQCKMSYTAIVSIPDQYKGGATVLKVGGDNFASGASNKNFLTPHFLASGGDKILLSQPNSFVRFVADWHWCWYFLLLSMCFQR